MPITVRPDRLARLAIASVLTFTAPSFVSAQATSTYEVVSSFSVPFAKGKNPTALVQTGDGTFYGTALLGGIFDTGTLFRMDATGTVTPVHNFSGADGEKPIALVRAAGGQQLFGVTSQGGQFGFGTVFRFTPGSGLATLHAFSDADSGPVDLFAASDGRIYGLTSRGGQFDNGTIFSIDAAGNFTTLHSVSTSVGTKMTSLVKGSDGRFYVVAAEGGGAGFGTLFTIDQAGTQTVLHTFTGQSTGDGARPVGLMQNHDGRLYGSTRGGGQSGAGIVYSVSLTGDYSVLHSFNASVDGSQGSADLLVASDGNLYGATQEDTKVFRIDSADRLTPLASPSADLAGDLIQGADGNLYVPTRTGGIFDGGLIYGRSLQGANVLLVDLSEGVGGDGRPQSVLQTRDGRLYGTTGAELASRGTAGTVFTLDASGTRTQVRLFRVLDGGFTGIFDGAPMSNLFEGADGTIYGTTFNDKLSSPTSYRTGQIFRITSGGASSVLSSSYHLRAGVIQARDGMLYGVSAAASDPTIANQTAPTAVPNLGSVFKVDASGTRTVLHVFAGGADGANPVAELVETNDGGLYGTTEGGDTPGTIFRVDAVTGAFTTLYRFTGATGSKPRGRLLQGSDGLLYGTTSKGGSFGFGTVFALDAAGALTTLHHFTGADGANPNAGVIQGSDGRLYGTTTNGGSRGYGTVFAITLRGALTTLHDFTLADGARPVAELTEAIDGSFYGAAPMGGPSGGGVIFHITPTSAPSNQYFEIISRSSGLCLDVWGVSMNAGANVIQWQCNGGRNQQWRLESVSGAYRIVARHSNLALDVSGARLDDMAPAIQWPANNGANQMWTLEPTTAGFVQIRARHSGKALDVEGASTANGARVIQYAPHSGGNQQWLLRAVAVP